MNQWIVETLNENVDAELEALPLDIRGKFIRVVSLIENFGLNNVGMPHIRPLVDKLWEIRLSGRDGIGRAIYVVGLDAGEGVGCDRPERVAVDDDVGDAVSGVRRHVEGLVCPVIDRGARRGRYDRAVRPGRARHFERVDREGRGHGDVPVHIAVGTGGGCGTVAP